MNEDYDPPNPKPSNTPSASPTLPRIIHYYGFTIRKLFLAASAIILVTLPLLNKSFSFSVLLSIVFILTLAFSAGLTSPEQKWSAIANILISVVGLIVFSFESITRFERFFDLTLIKNMALAAIFLFAFYLSIKTLRTSYTRIPKEKDGVNEELVKNTPPVKVVEIDQPTKHDKPDFLSEEERRKKRYLASE